MNTSMPKPAPDSFQADFCAARLKALSDSLRLRIIDALRSGELSVGDLAELLETEVVTVSHHLQILKHAELVTVRREGRFHYYRLHEELYGKKTQPGDSLDLGCCRIELPKPPKNSSM